MKVYMPNSTPRPGGGTCFHVSWERLVDFLRGKDRFAGSNAFLEENETCEFVVEDTGITVYVKKHDDPE
jgi:hypothetical protein